MLSGHHTKPHKAPQDNYYIKAMIDYVKNKIQL